MTNSTCCRVATVLAAVLLIGSPVVGQQRPARDILLQGNGAQLRLTTDLLYDPERSATFYTPTDTKAADNGNTYVLDEGDQDVKVLSPSGEFLFSFGGPGEGPGEFSRVWLMDISDEQLVYVMDRLALRYNVFTLDGEFLYSFRHPRSLPRQPKSFLVIDSSHIVISGGSLATSLYGHDLHLYEIGDPEGTTAATVYVRSVGQTEEYDPALYEQLVGGELARDGDGGILYTLNNPHNVRRYDSDLGLTWEVSDPDALPPATTYFKIDETGRIRVRAYPASISFFRLNDDYFINVTTFPPTWQQFEELPEGQRPHRTVFELIPASAPQQLGSWRRFETSERVFFHAIDGRSRLLGYWYFAARGGFLVRTAFELIPNQVEPVRSEGPATRQHRRRR